MALKQIEDTYNNDPWQWRFPENSQETIILTLDQYNKLVEDHWELIALRQSIKRLVVDGHQ